MRDDERYAFDKIPHGSLAFKLNRRQLIPTMLVELQAFSKKADRRAVLKLADLGNCPDEQLAKMIPCMVPGCQISVDDGYVCGKTTAVSKPFILFPFDTPALKVFNLFNGMTTIEEASSCLVEETGWNTERAFAYTRGVFLWLVLAGMCLPKGT